MKVLTKAILLIGLITIITGCGTSTPEGTVKKYLSLVSKGNIDQAKELCSPGWQTELEAIRRQFKGPGVKGPDVVGVGGLGPAKPLDLNKLRYFTVEEDNYVTVQVLDAMNGASFSLVKAEDGWKITSVAYPMFGMEHLMM